MLRILLFREFRKFSFISKLSKLIVRVARYTKLSKHCIKVKIFESDKVISW